MFLLIAHLIITLSRTAVIEFMTRQRTIKFPPKRGQLTIRQIERAVDKVIQKRRAQEAITSTPKEVRNRGTNSE